MVPVLTRSAAAGFRDMMDRLSFHGIRLYFLICRQGWWIYRCDAGTRWIHHAKLGDPKHIAKPT